MLVSQKLGKVCDDWEKENGTVIFFLAGNSLGHVIVL